MDLLAQARRALNIDDDALAAHRDRIQRNFSRLGFIVLSPFTTFHLLNVNWTMFVINATLMAVLLPNAWTSRHSGARFIPFWALTSTVVAAIFLSVLHQGLNGVLWAYPAMSMFYFVLKRSVAMVQGLLLLAAVTAASLWSLGLPMTTRIFTSLALVMVMINVALNVIGDLQRALQAQAITDPLTGAYNRRHLQDQLVQRVASGGCAVAGDALLAIDIDHFKRINDLHGHAVGDQVLCRLVAAIDARKRMGDLLFRTGGEEFVLLLPRVTLPVAQAVAEALRQRLAQADLIPGESITVSIGISALAAGHSVDTWLQAADTALYQAKHTGRNRVVVALAA